MSSITRRPSSAFRSTSIAVALCAMVAVAPMVAAAPGDIAARTSGNFWSPVVLAWNWVLETVFAPSSYVLDPNGGDAAEDLQAPEPPPSATSEGPVA